MLITIACVLLLDALLWIAPTVWTFDYGCTVAIRSTNASGCNAAPSINCPGMIL